MADEQQEVRRINWSEALTVSHVFKSFRMSIHFSKLMLALAAFLLIWGWGWILGELAGLADYYVPDKEIHLHLALPARDFETKKQEAQEARPGKVAAMWGNALTEWEKLQSFQGLLGEELKKTPRAAGNNHLRDHFLALLEDPNQKVEPGKAAPDEAGRSQDANEDWHDALSSAEGIFDKEIARIEGLLKACDAEDGGRKRIADDKSLDTDKKRAAAEEQLDADLQAAARALTLRKIAIDRQIRGVRGSTIFWALQDYEGKCLENAILAVRRLNFTGGLVKYRDTLAARSAVLPAAQVTPDMGLEPADPTPADDPPGFFYWLLVGAHGLGWLCSQHWLYALFLLAGALCTWALFGGAIHRIAALHFAREEKISMGQALRFAAGKFLSFFTAPLIPLAIVVFIGLFLALGGLIFGSWGGGILAGLLFPLALFGGLLMAFLLIGLGAGGGLMYPTIAVESSDSFDAISRSYSYVFGRPWRTAFYALAALIYGVICYLFVRFFAFLLLSVTRCFVQWGVWGGGESISPSADKLDVLWPAPTYARLLPAFHWQAMSPAEMVGGALMWLWVFVVAGLVIAFLLSYFANATTVIYFLLRRKVDATDLDDVYVEEEFEEEAAAPVSPAEEPPAAEPAEPAEQAEEAPAPKAKAKAKKTAKKADKKTAKKADKKAKKKAKKPEKE